MKSKKLFSTQRLPRLDLVKSGALRNISCRCHAQIPIPGDFRYGRVRCSSCGHILKVGIPPEFIRIPCNCGKILTARRQDLGKIGRCRNCGKSWSISETPKSAENFERIPCPCGKTLIAPKEAKGKTARCPSCKRQFEVGKASDSGKSSTAATVSSRTVTPTTPSPTVTTASPSPSAEEAISAQEAISTASAPTVATGPLHFKCDCGQPHMVEMQRIGETMRCFRCNNDIMISMPRSAVSQTTTQHQLHQQNWDFVNPYSLQCPFQILGLEKHATIDEVKERCREIQSQYQRNEPQFQQAQFAKDTISKPLQRLWYEILQDDLNTIWKGLAKNKLLKQHDTIITHHHEAIRLERELVYHKAQKFWNKAVQGWVLLDTSEEFWQAVRQRGEQLFSNKFKDKTLQELRKKLLLEVVIAIHTQFREKYLNENHQVQAEFHMDVLQPALERYFVQNPEDDYIKKTLIDWYWEKMQQYRLQGKTQKQQQLLKNLQKLTGDGDLEIQRIFAEFMM